MGSYLKSTKSSDISSIKSNPGHDIHNNRYDMSIIPRMKSNISSLLQSPIVVPLRTGTASPFNLQPLPASLKNMTKSMLVSATVFEELKHHCMYKRRINVDLTNGPQSQNIGSQTGWTGDGFQNASTIHTRFSALCLLNLFIQT